MRKLLTCLAVTTACLLASTAGNATPPACSWICCNDYDPGTECSTGTPGWPTDCQTWWHTGGVCP
jgi:hypothetical protein